MDKKDKTTIMIGVGSRPEGEPLAEELGMAEEADAEMYAAMAPRGDFTSRGLSPLVRGTNALLPIFGQTPDYPELGDSLDVLPTDFVRILAMFQAAVDDAIEADVVRDEMKIVLDNVRDDTALMTIGSKLEMLAKDKEFKRFLSEDAPEEEMEEGYEEAEEEMSSDQMDDMFMSRM